MPDRVITVYLNEDTGEAYYVDCPWCHFYKNVELGVPCRSTMCTYSGVTIKVPVTIQQPLSEPETDRCPDCRHSWNNHDQLLEGAAMRMIPEYNPYGVEDLYECNAYAGMGDWCGCHTRSRMTYSPEGPGGYDVPIPLEETNPWLPEPPADGQHEFRFGSYRCTSCGVYNRPDVPSTKEVLDAPCEGRWAQSGKMRAWAEEKWADEKRSS